MPDSGKTLNTYKSINNSTISLKIFITNKKALRNIMFYLKIIKYYKFY
jgi:hypothetical protein